MLDKRGGEVRVWGTDSLLPLSFFSGFSKEQIEASINSTEFAMRELNTGGFPKGIMIMLGALQQWLHDRDPIEPLKFEQPLATLKERLAAGEDVCHAP